MLCFLVCFVIFDYELLIFLGHLPVETLRELGYSRIPPEHTCVYSEVM